LVAEKSLDRKLASIEVIMKMSCINDLFRLFPSQSELFAHDELEKLSGQLLLDVANWLPGCLKD